MNVTQTLNRGIKAVFGLIFMLCLLLAFLPKAVSAEETNTWKPDDASSPSYVISTPADPDIGTVTIDVERFTIGQGFYKEPVTMSYTKDESVFSLVSRLVGADNILGNSSYMTGIKGTDAGANTVVIPDYIVSKLGGGDTATAKTYGNKQTDSALGTASYSAQGGWMFLVNNQSPTVGMGDYKVSNGDVIRIAFTYQGYGADLNGYVYGSTDPKVALGNRDELLKAIAAVNTDGKDAMLANAGVKAAYDNAVTVANDMTKTTENTKTAADVLNQAVADMKAAKAVADKIAALPTTDALALTDKTAVAAARTAYDALSATQKNLVTNLSTLTAAEAKIAELEKSSAVDKVTGIEVIGLPAGTAIKVVGETDNADKTAEAQKAAAAAGITDAKVVSLYDIKPDMSADDLAKFNNDPTTYVTINLPLSSDQQGYEAYKIYHKTEAGTVEWITPTLSADKKTLTFKVNSFSEFGVVGSKTDTKTKTVNCSYQTQIENIGWQDPKTNDDLSGTTGQSLRLEGIKINLDNQGYDLGVSYQTHVQDIGWQGFRTDGALSGTEGQSKRLEAIQIKLTGTDADKFDIYYRVHAENYGWMGWTKNGASAGTEGLSLRLEAIEIKVVAKDAATPGSTDQSFTTGNIKCRYQTQIQDIGWQDTKVNGDLSGTTGQSLRLEGIKINIENAGYQVGVSYQTHVQDIGWQDSQTDGAMSGTEGQSKRLEGIRISLTGTDADLCDIYYQVHAENIGWMGWAKNGESAGTEGFAYRLEGIRIMVVPKGTAAPGSTDQAFISNN